MKHFNTKVLCCFCISLLFFACTNHASKANKAIDKDGHTEHNVIDNGRKGSPIRNDTAYISLAKTVFVPKDSFINYSINNCFSSTIMYGTEYHVERYYKGRWIPVKCDVGFTLVAYYIEPNQKVDCRARLFPVYNLASGRYRIAKHLHVFSGTEDETIIKRYAEFTVKF